MRREARNAILERNNSAFDSKIDNVNQPPLPIISNSMYPRKSSKTNYISCAMKTKLMVLKKCTAKDVTVKRAIVLKNTVNAFN